MVDKDTFDSFVKPEDGKPWYNFFTQWSRALEKLHLGHVHSCGFLDFLVMDEMNERITQRNDGDPKKHFAKTTLIRRRLSKTTSLRQKYFHEFKKSMYSIFTDKSCGRMTEGFISTGTARKYCYANRQCSSGLPERLPLKLF